MNALAAGQFFQRCPFGAFPRDNKRNTGHMPQAADQDIESLVGMQAAKGQQKRGSFRQSRRPDSGCMRQISGEIRQVVHPLFVPALFDHPCFQPACIADQMRATAIISEIVIPSQPSGQHPVALGGKLGGAVHPRNGNARCKSL